MRLLIVISAIVLSVAQSQSPSPRPAPSIHTDQHKTEFKQKQSDNNDNSTKQLIAVINQLITAIEAEKKQKLASQSESKPSSEGWYKASSILIMIFTGVLAIVAVLQWRAMHKQAEYMRQGLGETVKAADAAKASADGLIGVERPWIMVSTADMLTKMIERSDEPGEARQPHTTVQFTLKNSGKTPAIIDEVIGGVDFIEFLAHRNAVYEAPTGFRTNLILSPGETTDTIEFILSTPLTPDQREKLIRGTSAFIVGYGKVAYSDVFGKKHVSKFCYIYDLPRSRFHYLCHNTAHNEYN